MLTARTVSRIDFNFLGTAIVLVSIGCGLIYSATYFGRDAGLFQKQLIWVGLGIVVMLVCIAIDYRTLVDTALIPYAIGIILLGYLLIWGRTTANVKSWIHIAGFQFQPSEFMKIATALVLARFFESADRAYLTARSFAMVSVIVGAPLALILLQPDFGSAATFAPLVAAAMFFGGIRARHWVVVFLLVALAAPTAWFFVLKPYQKERILVFVNPDRDPLGSGYQVLQSRIAIGSGGITGKGFKQGTQAKLEYLPARHTDFIFAVLGEEWGFVGVLVVLTLYLFLIIQALAISKTARDRGGMFLVICLTLFFVFHIVVNVSMQIGMLPITGIPLPFLSYGGSSTIAFFTAIGLILSVDYRKFVNV